MPPETPQKPTDTAPVVTPVTPTVEPATAVETPVTTPAAEKAPAAPYPSPTPTSEPAAPPKSDKFSSPLPSALQPTDTPFNSLEQAKDVWQLIWKGAVWVNGVLAALFVVMLVLKLTKLAGEALSAVAVGVPFWLLPVLLGVDAAALGAYFLLKRPKLNEFVKVAVWVGISLAVVFVVSITYVVVQSVS